MKDLRSKLNGRSKGEQLFIITLMFVTLIGLFCVTGCGGGKSCEKIKYGSEDLEGATVRGCSVPGCGGCLTSGKGCNSSCWAQSCKVVSVSGSEKEESTGKKTSISEVACDVRYYGDGCLGCDQREKNCYNGCIYAEYDGDGEYGFFYGSSDNDEKFIGCHDGCGGCVGSDGIGGSEMYDLERVIGVE